MKHLLILTLLTASLLFTGCGSMYNAETEVQTFDQPMVQTVDGDIQKVDSYIAATGQAPAPEQIIPAGTPVVIVKHVPNSTLTGASEFIKSLPIPYADVAGYVLSGLISIGALWQNRKKRFAEKMNRSLVQGIDTYRDIIDQTEEGEKMDKALTGSLRHHQDKLQTTRAVLDLLDRYATPTKPKGGIKLG